MTAERFEALVQRLLDRELESAEVDELAAELRENPERRREVREHLVLWELWAQRQSAQRSEEVFLAAFRTRLRAEEESEGFVAELRRRIERDNCLRAGSLGRWRSWWRGRRPGWFATWVAASMLSAAALVAALWIVTPHQARAAATLHGQAVCTACMLHETHEHLPAILVREGGGTSVYYVQSDRTAILRVGDYCLAPVPIVASGQTAQRDGRRTIAVEHAARDQPQPDDQPALIPF